MADENKTTSFWDLETIPVSVTFGKLKVMFPLRIVDMAKERELRKKIYDEKVDDNYQAKVDAIAELINDKPVGIPENPEITNAELVTEFFAERTALKDRVAHFTMVGYFTRLMPEEMTG